MSRLSSAFVAALGVAQSGFGASPLAARDRGRPLVHVRMTKHFYRFNHGDVRLSDYSSLRKLMRAARRGKLPEERLGTIERAMQSANRSPFRYMHSTARNVAEAMDAQYEQYVATRS